MTLRSYAFYCPGCDRYGEMIVTNVFEPDEPVPPELYICQECGQRVDLVDLHAVDQAPAWKQ